MAKGESTAVLRDIHTLFHVGTSNGLTDLGKQGDGVSTHQDSQRMTELALILEIVGTDANGLSFHL